MNWIRSVLFVFTFLTGFALTALVALAGAFLVVTVGPWTMLLSLPALSLVMGSFCYILDNCF